ncbi:hypothetical protein [Marispirochaeta aestuarii]|uniref:hypothetical protein n=1 Tax=Marispirochaeta aestuarii TaxID=1963862 RepID=UPI002ABE775A|nr:hypothetical protein [Marispirochaeta aestuarii]
MEEKYVNDFFETGAIRLSSFANFLSSNHAERFDKDEGKTNLIAKTKNNGGQTFSCWFQTGQEAYVLCGSTRYSKSLEESFDDSCIQINNSVAFAQEIAKCIPGFIDGLEGLCIYQNQKIIEKDIGYISPEVILDKKNPSKLNEKAVMQLLFQIGGHDVYFLKPIRYIKQNEYRFIWRTNSRINDALIISCPEARKYCQRPSNWNRIDSKIDGSPRMLISTQTDTVKQRSVSIDGEIPFPKSWKRRHAIGFPPSTDDLKDFSIRLTRGALNDEIVEPDGLFSSQIDGGDIRFSLDKEGAFPLPADIIKFGYDSKRGSRDADIDIIVKVPVLPSAHCLTIFIWYLTETEVTQPEPNSEFGRNNAYDKNWKSYHPYNGINRLNERM